MDVTIRPMQEQDLRACDIVFRVALGTIDGLPAPIRYGGDTDYVTTRWRADPGSAFAAIAGDNPVGSVFVARWGSLGVVGPLTVHPNMWDRAIGTRLMEPAIELLDRWGVTHACLHTMTHSGKHIELFRKFGFWPRCLIEVMSKRVKRTKASGDISLFSELSDARKAIAIGDCRRITESIYPGLDLEREITAVNRQELGDTLLLTVDGALAGFAVAHWGPGTEAGTGRFYVKFGAVGKHPDAPNRFDDLLVGCELLAATRGASQLVAGVNTARNGAGRHMLAYGFVTESVGVAMHRPYKPAYNREGVYVIDDWR